MTDSTFTSRQRSHLRRLAQKLRPSVHVGKEGVGGPAIHALSEAFNTRELIKLRVNEGAPDGIRETAERLASEVPGAAVVYTIGRTAVLYRPHPDDPQIDLDRLS